LIPSNLGQIVGRLMYGEDFNREPLKVPASTAAVAHRGRHGQVLELVRARGEVATADVVAALNITSDHACVLLLKMWREGALVRSGEKRVYRYALP